MSDGLSEEAGSSTVLVPLGGSTASCSDLTPDTAGKMSNTDSANTAPRVRIDRLVFASTAS